MKRAYVVDTNVLVHWLLKPDSLAARIINSLMLDLFTPTVALSELIEHRSEWTAKNPDVAVDDFTTAISSFVQIVRTPVDARFTSRAEILIGYKDTEDVPFLALALATGADIWSYDQHFDGIPGVARVRSEEIRDRSFDEFPELWTWINTRT
jgi:predicted nucleic acid-binding protein